MNAIFKRKSIRKFLDKEIEDGKIERLLKARLNSNIQLTMEPIKPKVYLT